MSDDRTFTRDRALLAEQQAGLVAALARKGSAPEGFDSTHFDRTAGALLGKRRRTVEKSWPTLASSLGDSFRETFLRFAETHPLAVNDSIDDGRCFAEFLLAENCLPAETAPILLAVRLRSGSPLQTLRLNNLRWIGFRLPLLGTRIFRLWSSI